MTNIISRISKDRDFLMCALTIQISHHMRTNDLDYHGSMHMYDLIADVVDELMAGDEYKKYLDDIQYFNTLGTCLDWYYMDKCIPMITEERIDRVAFPSKYAGRKVN